MIKFLRYKTIQEIEDLKLNFVYRYLSKENKVEVSNHTDSFSTVLDKLSLFYKDFYIKKEEIQKIENDIVLSVFEKKEFEIQPNTKYPFFFHFEITSETREEWIKNNPQEDIDAITF